MLERVVAGILDYARACGGWSMSRAPERLDSSVDWLKHWDGDGALVVLTRRKQAALARRMPMPVVNLGGYLRDSGVPTVAADDVSIGRMTAEHLLERRYVRFGYFGPRGVWYVSRRLEGFRAGVLQQGASVEVLWAAGPFEAVRGWVDERQELTKWLRRLEPPVGIMAATDQRALMVLDACARVGLRVPEDIAIVGVDNDVVACEFSRPSLSSVDRDDLAHGRMAAGLLDRLMRGQRPAFTPILVRPQRVVARGSTDALAIEDATVAAVVARAKEHLGERFGVERLVQWANLSRRTLEGRFRQSLGWAPYEFLCRMRVERAKTLLLEPVRRPLASVAAECGFGEPRRLREAFQRVVGMGPVEFRRTSGP